jgi:hypothetical protein
MSLGVSAGGRTAGAWPDSSNDLLNREKAEGPEELLCQGLAWGTTCGWGAKTRQGPCWVSRWARGCGAEACARGCETMERKKAEEPHVVYKRGKLPPQHPIAPPLNYRH